MHVKSHPFLQRQGDKLIFLTVYMALFAVWDLTGGSFKVWPDLWQLLPWPPLLENLGGSLLDLHSQPPFLNLLFGLSLKASAVTGISVESLLEPIYFVIGAVTVLMITSVAAQLITQPWVRRAILFLILLNPYFYAVHHYLFYTAWELIFLSMTAFFSLRYFDRPGAGRLVAVLLPAVLLVYTRSLFHPLWFALLLATTLLLGRPRRPAMWKPISLVAIMALILVAAWPLKNFVRFGFFGLSSWSGMSIARGLPTGEPLTSSGYPIRIAAFARSSSEPLDPAAAAKAQSLVPPEFHDHATLSALTKPDGSPNWNHYAMIPLSRQLGTAALRELRRTPSLLLMKAIDFYLNGYAIYEARWPYRQDLSQEMTTGHTWARIYEEMIFQRFQPYDPGRTEMTTGFAVLFPLVLLAAAIALQHRRPWAPSERTIVLLLLSILWVLALVLFVDGPEGNRVRYSTEPALFLVSGWLVGYRRNRKAPEPQLSDQDRVE